MRRTLLKQIFCLTVALLPLASAWGQDRLILKQENETTETRFRQLYADKNRPFPNFLTEVPTKASAKADKVMLIKQSQPRNAEKKSGGISDGGGNAVGAVLFDFYENQGSVEVTAEELCALEPLCGEISKALDARVAVIGQIDKPLGQQLLSALAEKKIYLEQKPITSEDCVNESLVATEEQIIVACQSDRELRLYVKWLMSTDKKNRAGLIFHEKYLAAFQKMYSGNALTKKQYEGRVRELNRATFEKIDSIANAIKELTGQWYVLSPQDKEIVKKIQIVPSIQSLARKRFCETGSLEEFAQVRDIYKNGNEIIRKSLEGRNQSIGLLLKNLEINTMSPSDVEDLYKGEFCENKKLDLLPLQVPENPLPKACKSDIEFVVNSTTDLFDQFKSPVQRYSTEEGLFKGGLGIFLNSCVRTSGRGKQMYFDGLQYAKYLFALKGFEVSFQDETLKRRK